MWWGKVNSGFFVEFDVRPMTIGEILDGAFELVQKDLKLLLGIACSILLPFSLINQILSVRFESSMNQWERFETTPAEVLTSALIMMVVALFVALVPQLLVTLATIRVFKDRISGVTPTYKSAIVFSLRRYFPYLLTMTLQFLAIVIGLFFCLIPGIVVALALSLVPYVFVYEEESYFDALQRSWKLIFNSSNFLTVFVLGLVAATLSSSILVIPSVFPVGPYIGVIMFAVTMTALSFVSSAIYFVLFLSCKSTCDNLDVTMRVEYLKNKLDQKERKQEQPLIDFSRPADQ